MSLTPKNWSTFQHYKDRKPAWIKLHHSLLDDYKFGCLPIASKALAPLLWLLASEYEDGVITASLEEIAFRLRVPPHDLGLWIKPLVDNGFFSLASTSLAEPEQVAIPEREREEETEKRKNIRAVAHATRPASNEEFLEFWKVYPRRQGANPKHPAQKKFEAQVKSGVSPETIIAAARAYEAEQRKLGHVGTPYIAQAVTWLNQQRFDDYQSKTSGSGPPAGLTAEQQAKWVRDQMEAEREKNSNGVEQIGLVLGRGQEIRGAPPESERSAGMVCDYPRNAKAH